MTNSTQTTITISKAANKDRTVTVVRDGHNTVHSIAKFSNVSPFEEGVISITTQGN